MLRKIDSKMVRQKDPLLRRRWYWSEEADLVVDRDRKTRELVWFELTWVEGRFRFGCRWGRSEGVVTGAVDLGETGDVLQPKGAPILIPDSEPKPDRMEKARNILRASELPEISEHLEA